MCFAGDRRPFEDERVSGALKPQFKPLPQSEGKARGDSLSGIKTIKSKIKKQDNII